MDYLNILLLLMVFVTNSAGENPFEELQKHFGEGYGTEWMYFPDGDGKLHYINLALNDNDIIVPAFFFNDKHLQFRLFNKNFSSYILLDYQGRAKKSKKQKIVTDILRSKLPLKLITHGWISSAAIEPILEIKDAYLQAQNVNVITVDWSGAALDFYFWTAHKTWGVGVVIASFLNGLNKAYQVTGDQLHLIGHSLGAHVMGNAASNTSLSVHRVTGLDPAGPAFAFLFEKGPDIRLDPSDAEIVDVIHTAAGTLGYKDPLGTVDFYPNGGKAPQPGCGGILKWFGACSHSLAFQYFKESIQNPKKYPAYKCESWQDFQDNRWQCKQTGYMGDSVNGQMTGTHYLHAKASKTFHYINYVKVLPDIQLRVKLAFSNGGRQSYQWKEKKTKKKLRSNKYRYCLSTINQKNLFNKKKNNRRNNELRRKNIL